MTPAQIVGIALKNQRWLRGQSIEEAAAAAEISHVTWRRLERGEGVRQQTLTKLEDHLGLEHGVLARAMADKVIAKMLADRLNGQVTPFESGAAMAGMGRGFVASEVDSPEVQAEAHARKVGSPPPEDPPERELVHQWDTPSRALARRLGEVRKARGLTFRQVAGECFRLGQTSLRPEVIEAIEQGERGPVSVDELFALAYALDVAPVNLVVPLEPRDDVHEHLYWFVPEVAMTVNQVREWVRGNREWLRGRVPAAPGVDPIAYMEQTPPVEWVPKERSPNDARKYSDTVRGWREGRELFQPSTALLPDADDDDLADPAPLQAGRDAIDAALELAQSNYFDLGPDSEQQ